MFHPHPTLREAHRSQYGEPYQYYGTQNLLDPNMAYCKYHQNVTVLFYFIFFRFKKKKKKILLVHLSVEKKNNFYDHFLFPSRWTVTCSCSWSSHDVLELTTRGNCAPSVWATQSSEPSEWKQLPRAAHSVNIPTFLL